MKTFNSSGLWTCARTGLITVVLMCLGQSALGAGLSANAQLQNTVTVNYENLGGTAQTAVNASVFITISLVQAQPTLAYISSSPVDNGAEVPNISEGETVTQRIQATSNSNGPDTYTMTLSESVSLLNSSTLNDPSAFILGASMTAEAGSLLVADCLIATPNAASAGNCDLNVPNDTAATIGSGVNGIAGTDRVLFVGDTLSVYCTVNAVTDNEDLAFNLSASAASGDKIAEDASVIQLKDCSSDIDGAIVPAATLAYSIGADILETQLISFTVDITTLTTSPTPGQTTVTGTIDVDGGGGLTAVTEAALPIFVVAANLTVRKFVRNVDSGVVGSAGAAGDILDLAGVTYYRAGVTALPGETLEYAIVMINEGGSVQNIIATDPSVPFTSYIVTDGSDLAKGIVLYEAETLTDNDCTSSGGFTCEVSSLASTATVNDDASLTGTASDHGGNVSGDITIYAGVGGDEQSGGDKGGTIAAGLTSIATYRVLVD